MVSAARVARLASACADAAGWRWQFSGNHFQLQTDRGQPLPDARMQLAPQSLALHLNLANGFASSAPAPPLRTGKQVPLHPQQTEEMKGEPALKTQQVLVSLDSPSTAWTATSTLSRDSQTVQKRSGEISISGPEPADGLPRTIASDRCAGLRSARRVRLLIQSTRPRKLHSNSNGHSTGPLRMGPDSAQRLNQRSPVVPDLS